MSVEFRISGTFFDRKMVLMRDDRGTNNVPISLKKDRVEAVGA